MKILNLKIMNPLGDVIRDIDFKENGVSFIYGDIQEPKNKKATINSLGKTLLLKLIDYIFGANEDPKSVSEELKDYKIKATVLFKGKQYVVIRTIGDSKNILIGNKPYPLTDYKTFFDIDRNLYHKQTILSKKATELSTKSSPDKRDVISCLELLGLASIVDDVDGIYVAQDRLKSLNAQKKELVSYYGGVDVKQIDEEIYFVDKEVTRLEEELKDISKKIKDIEVSGVQQNVVEEYAKKSKKLKKLKQEYEDRHYEHERLSEFVEKSRKTDVTSEHVLLIFEKVKQEVPEMLKRNLQEVEAFHQKVFEERKAFLDEKKQKLEEEMKAISVDLKENSEKLDELGKVIAVNAVYQESIALYEKYNTDLQELKFKQGKLSQVKEVDNSIETESNTITEKFSNVTTGRKNLEQLVGTYRDFIYNLIKAIYDEEVNSYFDIKIRKRHSTQRPIVFEFNLKGDTGEGVSEVKKNVMDYLVCNYNKLIEVLLQDSACYNGIDPRQVAGMLNEICKIAEEANKQVIIAINKYQVMGYDECIDNIVSHSAITLSEKNKLLKFNF